MATTKTDIKGGGRATMSDETQDAIVDLLRSLRDPNNPLRPKSRGGGGVGDGEDGAGAGSGPGSRQRKEERTDHDGRRERRRFLKRLVECHERRELALRMNGRFIGGGGAAAAGTDGPGAAPAAADGCGSAGGASGSSTLAEAPSPPSAGEEVAGKVRIDLVEAIYPSKAKASKDGDDGKKKSKKEKSDSKSTSKKKKKSSSSDASRQWKEGQTRKTIVLPRSTSVKDLLAQAKAKLRMKKKPIRCFCVDGESGIEMDLTVNLAGLDDGAVIYATSHADDREERKGREGETNIDGEEKAVVAEEEDAAIEDPLDSVKKAYAERRRRKVRRRRRGRGTNKPHNDASTSTEGSQKEPPTLSDCLEKLEELPRSRAELPAATYRHKILQSLDASRVVVICGETGCGKSTQVPQFLLEGMTAAGRSDDAHIIVTQPRRVAATSLAERVASERSCPPPGSAGSVVGYNVRLSRAVSDEAKIVYCTVGVLLRMLVNPTEMDEDELCPAEERAKAEATEKKASIPLASVSHVVIDEVHERDISTDFVLTLLRPVLAVNRRLKIILMSATSSPGLFVDYFRDSNLGIEPRVLTIPGRTHPVTTFFLPDCEKFARARLQGWTEEVEESLRGDEDAAAVGADIELSPRATARIDNRFICKLIAYMVRQQREDGKLSVHGSTTFRKDGAILVFLPGKGEIESLARVLYDDSLVGDRDVCNVLKLHSTAPQAEQRAVFHPAKVGTVKIVLATNVAETSITIPDASAVIDTGRVKESRFNVSARIKELVTVWTSQASATQRAGRAGRTGPGVCYKLYTQPFLTKIPQRTSPEIVRTPLDELILQCCLLEEHRQRTSDTRLRGSTPSSLVGTSPIKFLSQAPEPPPTRSLLHSCKHLLEVGGLQLVAKEPELLFRLTPLGYHIAHLPMDAKVAKSLIVGCILECIEPALTVAAALSHSKSIWLPILPGVQGSSKQDARGVQKALVENGFGGINWKGGSVKGDLFGVIAAYNSWAQQPKENDRRSFASKNALDHGVLREIRGLRSQFKEALIDAGFLESRSGCDSAHDDALLTSCCLVAGMHPNIATLMRPKKGRGNLRGGRLITKDRDICKASNSSFQADRIWNAAENGRDAYAVFHAKHRTVGADAKSAEHRQQEVFLSEINFVSRFAMLLFAGDIEVRDNAIILDGWLKFKIGDKGKTGCILIVELRKELDYVMLRHIMSGDRSDKDLDDECQQIMAVVRKLLAEE